MTSELRDKLMDVLDVVHGFYGMASHDSAERKLEIIGTVLEHAPTQLDSITDRLAESEYVLNEAEHRNAKLAQQLAESEKERERLREALKQIRDRMGQADTRDYAGPYIPFAFNIARQALSLDSQEKP